MDFLKHVCVIFASLGSNTRNGSEDLILIKETDSSGIQQKINETHVTTKSEINNDNATKHYSHTTKYCNNSTEQYNNEKKKHVKLETKMIEKKRSLSSY